MTTILFLVTLSLVTVMDATMHFCSFTSSTTNESNRPVSCKQKHFNGFLNYGCATTESGQPLIQNLLSLECKGDIGVSNVAQKSTLISMALCFVVYVCCKYIKALASYNLVKVSAPDENVFWRLVFWRHRTQQLLVSR